MKIERRNRIQSIHFQGRRKGIGKTNINSQFSHLNEHRVYETNTAFTYLYI